MQRQDVKHNTREEVVDAVLETVSILDECEIEGAERVALLPSALGLVAGKQIVMTQPQPVDLGALARSRGLH